MIHKLTTSLKPSLFAAAMLACSNGHAQAGALDVSFSGDGIATASFSLGQLSVAHGIAVQSDGRIVVAGDADQNSSQWAVARFLPNGDPDNSFSGDGQATFAPGGNGTNCYAVVIDPATQKILLGGFRNTTAFTVEAVVLRLNSDGSLDTGFGTSGTASMLLGGSASGGSYINAMVVQADGKIVMAGGADGDAALVRFQSSGFADNSFGSSGRVTVAVGAGTEDGAYGLVLQTDGKLVATGYTGSGTSASPFLARFTSSGALDIGFGSGGTVVTDLGIGFNFGYGVSMNSDDKVLLTGVGSNGVEQGCTVLRYLPDGSLDTSFDGDGIIVITFPATAIGGRFIHALANGSILVVGVASDDILTYGAVLRILSDGALDTSFDTDGIVLTSGPWDEFWGGALQSDGKLVACGSTFTGDHNDMAAFRFLIEAEQSVSSLRTPGNALSVSPNPATERVAVGFELSTGGSCSLRLRDALGAVVREFFSQRAFAAGKQSVDCDLGYLAPGIYSFELITPDAARTTRVVKP